MTLRDCEVGACYRVSNIASEDEELLSFLFTLGLYRGEPITVISRKRGVSIVSIKDGRYCIDNRLAEAVSVG